MDAIGDIFGAFFMMILKLLFGDIRIPFWLVSKTMKAYTQILLCVRFFVLIILE